MKIALFTDGIYPYVMGGMQRHSFYLTKYLAQQHIHVDLYHTNQSNLDIAKLDCFSADEKKYINSIVIPFRDNSNIPGHYLRASYNYSKDVFRAFFKNKEVDFIYTKGFTGWYLLKQKAIGIQCPPVGVNFHGYEMFQKAASFRSWLEQIFLFRAPVKYIVNHTDVVFSYGGKITRLIQQLITTNTKICEIATGIDQNWLIPAAYETKLPRKFIFVGRFERRKGVEELTEVLRDLVNDHKFSFQFIGPIPANKQINHPQISYLGSITDIEKLKSVLRSADILVCPSHSEGMPNVIVEAMASGLAVIATDVGAVNMLVSENNGWLIPVDKGRLKNALISAMQLPNDTINRKKKAALEIVANNFLWPHIIDKHIVEIKTIIKKHNNS